MSLYLQAPINISDAKTSYIIDPNSDEHLLKCDICKYCFKNRNNLYPYGMRIIMNDAYLIYPCNKKEVKKTGILKDDKKSNNYIMIGSNSQSFSSKKEMDCSGKKYTQYGTGNLKNYLKTKTTTNFIHDFRNMYNLDLETNQNNLGNFSNSNNYDNSSFIYNDCNNTCSTDFDDACSHISDDNIHITHDSHNYDNDIINNDTNVNHEHNCDCSDSSSINSFEY